MTSSNKKVAIAGWVVLSLFLSLIVGFALFLLFRKRAPRGVYTSQVTAFNDVPLINPDTDTYNYGVVDAPTVYGHDRSELDFARLGVPGIQSD